jgi:hypothetical protein
MNRFRIKVKKKVGSDPSSIKPSMVNAGSSSTSYLGVGAKDNKRKAASVSGPPDVSSPVHQVRTRASDNRG